MSSIVYLKNRKTNTTYVYLNESKWDPEKKKCVCKRKCIGHLDPKTGEIVSNQRKHVQKSITVRSVVVTDVLDKISRDMGLTEALSKTFPVNWRIMLSVAYYILLEEDDLLYCEEWSENTNTPFGGTLNYTVITGMLSSIAPYHISRFFTEWIERNQCDDVYTQTLLFRDDFEKLRKYAILHGIDIDEENYGTSMEVYFATKNSIPMCYTINNLNIGRSIDSYGIHHTDFKKLTETVEDNDDLQFDIDSFGDPERNVTALLNKDRQFTMEAIDRVRKDILDGDNYRIVFGTSLFISSYMSHYKGRRCYTHVAFNPNRAVKELSSFIGLVNGCMHELKNNDRKEEHEPFYDKYLTISQMDDMQIVEQNGQNIFNHDQNVGYTVVMSNTYRDPERAMIPFLVKELFEKVFRNIDNENDNTNMNLYTESNYQTRIFIQFLAFILRTQVEHIMNDNNLNKSMDYKQLVQHLSSIKTVTVPGQKKSYYSETSDVQKNILKAFGFSITSDAYKEKRS